MDYDLEIPPFEDPNFGAIKYYLNFAFCEKTVYVAVQLYPEGNISKSSGRYWGHAGLFFKGRKALPHFIERRISLKIHVRTAP